VKIAILTVTNEWGGAEIHAVQLAGTIRDRGHEVTIVCLTERTYSLYSERSSGSVDLAALFMPKEWWRMNFIDWLRLLRHQSWNACVFIKGSLHVGGWALDLVLRLLFANYLTLEQLNAEPLPAKTNRRRLLFLPSMWRYKEFLNGFSRSVFPRKIVCVSDLGGRRLIEDFAFPKKKVSTVHNGIDPEKYRRDAAQGRYWRQRWNIGPSSVVFGAIGRLSQRKGYEIALRAFQKLITALPGKDFRLVLVGEGPNEQVLTEIASKTIPPHHVIFSPFSDRPWELLSAIDVFVMPSLNEGLPLALLEAMACGCCPIATAVGGIPEVINSSKLGWLTPPDDVDAFAAAMIDAASRNPQELHIMGALARKHIVKNFNAVSQFKLLADLIESLLATTMIVLDEERVAPTQLNKFRS
jgi:glycosyltransferase involved in cell wall biosynthesis